MKTSILTDQRSSAEISNESEKKTRNIARSSGRSPKFHPCTEVYEQPVCLHWEQARGGREKGRENERTSHGLCRLKHGSRWVGVKWQILVRKLAFINRFHLLKTSRFSATYAEGTSQQLCSPPSSPTQFRLAEVPLPSTRWLKLQTDPLCVRGRARHDEREEERAR